MVVRERDLDTKRPGLTLRCDFLFLKIETLSITGKILKKAATIYERDNCVDESGDRQQGRTRRESLATRL